MQNPTPEISEARIKQFRKIPFQDTPNPAFIVHTDLLKANGEILKDISTRTGAKILLAQKGYSCFSTYPILRAYLDGTSSSGTNEALLAKEHFGKEIHVYSPAFTSQEVSNLASFSHTIIFNSMQQLAMGITATEGQNRPEFGLRINPQVSTGNHDLYDPCTSNSRLGTIRSTLDKNLNDYPHTSLNSISGLHFHTLCEEDSDALEKTALAFEANFKDIIKNCKWLNFGGGHHITRPGYDINRLCKIIEYFQKKYDLTIYLEPGEAVALHTGILNAKVLDILETENTQSAILNISATCHMPDVLEMPYRPNILDGYPAKEKAYTYKLGGLSCLAGDIIGDYSFEKPLKINDTIQFLDMSHYTMVKTSTFNGVPLPAICLFDESNGLKIVRSFTYEDYRDRLS
jgi:carboxynorspermidine decarboxylase